MYLSICTGVYGAFSYPETLDKVKAHGLDYVELCVGGWGGYPHGYATDLLADENKLNRKYFFLPLNLCFQLFRKSAGSRPHGRKAQ